ncbi:hypothetical protein GOP47_0011123 [Adiantum capillus-veneris]|uniref:Uncharacterized protein n=1 Tax=Adiantum capillus-veneris TaxID=13818 RepID=A0A9D4US68_ADICA|nr:hypothetical protein GOP47_0011123 [Adiantum capillus-veneris]
MPRKFASCAWPPMHVEGEVVLHRRRASDRSWGGEDDMQQLVQGHDEARQQRVAKRHTKIGDGQEELSKSKENAICKG